MALSVIVLSTAGPVQRGGTHVRCALIFSLLGVGWIGLAFHWRGAGWIAAWPGVSFLVVGLAYGGLGPSVFGKRPNGRVSPGGLLLLLPYVLLAWASWAVVRLVSSEPACSEVAPGLWVGRRPIARELPADVKWIVDLTCELWEPRSVRGVSGYTCEPTLDEQFLPEERAANLIRQLASASGTILIHCAQGHGRSAALAAAVMVARGQATDLEDARSRIAAIRPGIRIHRFQRDAAEQTLSRMRTG